MALSKVFWKCPSCSFESSLGRDLAEQVHHAYNRGCEGLLTSYANPGHLEGVKANANPGRLEGDEAFHGPQFRSNDILGHSGQRQRSRSPPEHLIKMIACAVCKGEWKSAATTRCRHFACCGSCLNQLTIEPDDNKRRCPVCRGPIESQFPVKFHSEHLIKSIPVLDYEDPSQDDNGGQIRPCSSSVMAVSVCNGSYLDRDEPSDDADGQHLTWYGQLLVMGYDNHKINRAIQRASNMIKRPTLNDILDIIDDGPTPEELLKMVQSPRVEESVKGDIYDGLKTITKCKKCSKREPVMQLMPCNHLVFCMECWREIASTGQRVENCPDCGEEVNNHVSIYLT